MTWSGTLPSTWHSHFSGPYSSKCLRSRSASSSQCLSQRLWRNWNRTYSSSWCTQYRWFRPVHWWCCTMDRIWSSHHTRSPAIFLFSSSFQPLPAWTLRRRSNYSVSERCLRTYCIMGTNRSGRKSLWSSNSSNKTSCRKLRTASYCIRLSFKFLPSKLYSGTYGCSWSCTSGWPPLTSYWKLPHPSCLPLSAGCRLSYPRLSIP